MKFSIIIPTYNSSRFIFQCLESILCLNFDKSEYEVLVVDGGSTDNTIELVGLFPSVKLMHSKNISIANSRNIGAAKAIGNSLVFIDSDCAVDKDLLWKAEKHLLEFECCGSFYKSSNEHGWVARSWLIAERKETGIVNWITSGTLAVRKDIFSKISGFNESLETEEDEDFGVRVRLNGGKLMNDLSIASIHLGQADTIYDHFIKEMWRGKSLIKPRSQNRKTKFSLFDLVILCYSFSLCLFFISCFFCFTLLFLVTIAFLFFMPLVLVIRKVLHLADMRYLFQMYVLYFVYLLARSVSLVRYNQFKNLFCRK